MLSPRENMLRTLRCEDAEWIPVTVYIDTYNHPSSDSLPADLADLFREKVNSWDKRCELFIPLSEFLGVNEYMLDAPTPYRIICTNGVEEYSLVDGEDIHHIIKTPKGELKQITKYGTIRKHYIQSIEDVEIFSEYVNSWDIKKDSNKIAAIKQMKAAINDNGIIRAFGPGTPLGMMYRKYTGVTDLIYLIADYPEQVRELFCIMENKYLEMYKLLLESSPEIDLIRAMDDTSTTIISPGMFEKYSVELTNKRVELVHEYEKMYFHHSCGLIYDLLPVYRKTKINGVDAFTPPPIGNVTYNEGRKLAGNNISFISAFTVGLNNPDKDTYKKIIKERFENAKEAKHVLFELSTPDNLHDIDFLKIGFEEARKYQKY